MLFIYYVIVNTSIDYIFFQVELNDLIKIMRFLNNGVENKSISSIGAHSMWLQQSVSNKLAKTPIEYLSKTELLIIL